jgi:hypothetical protein
MAVDFALHTHERDCCGSGEAGTGKIKISDCDLYSGLPRLPPDPVMSFRPWLAGRPFDPARVLGPL